MACTEKRKTGRGEVGVGEMSHSILAMLSLKGD